MDKKKIVYEIIPKSKACISCLTIPIKFRNKIKGGIGEIHLSKFMEELKNINLDDIDIEQPIVESHAISLYFPVFENYFDQMVVLDHSFSFKDIVEAIYETGIHAFEWDIKEHPEHYPIKKRYNNFRRLSKKSKQKILDDILSHYVINSGDIGITGNCVYVTLENALFD